MDKGYKVRQSKITLIVAILDVIISSTIFGGLVVFFIYKLVNKTYIDTEDFWGYIIALCLCACFLSIWLIIGFYCIYIYLKQIDLFCENKMIRKLGNKLKFELEYSNIINLKEGYFSLFLICEKPVIKANGKKGPRTIIEQYSLNDKRRIKQIILNSKERLNF